MDSQGRTAVRDTLDSLKPYLQAWVQNAVDGAAVGHSVGRHSGADLQALLKLVIAEWDNVFAKRLKPHARTYFFELKDLRNRWAHEDEFTADEVARAKDTVNQVLKVIGAPSLRPSSAKILPSPLRKKSNQRDTMRAIYERVGDNEDRLIAEYAAAERRGDVVRKRNTHGRTPEEYARALLKDAEKKGWLSE